MFFMHLRMSNARFRTGCYVYAQEETLAVSGTQGTSAAAAKRRRRQEDAQQRDSRLALARLAHSVASNLQPVSTVVRVTTHALH